MLREQNGVTLVALVVTIIVLLILTGVSLSMVLGQNGVLTQASTAVVAQTQADTVEKVTTALTSIETEYQGKWAKDTSLKRSEFYTVENLKDQFTGTVEVFEYEETDVGTEFTIYDGGTIKNSMPLEDASGEPNELKPETVYLLMLEEDGSTSFVFFAYTNSKLDVAPEINKEKKSKAAGSSYVSYIDVSEEKMANYEVEKGDDGKVDKSTLKIEKTPTDDASVGYDTFKIDFKKSKK